MWSHPLPFKCSGTPTFSFPTFDASGNVNVNAKVDQSITTAEIQQGRRGYHES